MILKKDKESIKMQPIIIMTDHICGINVESMIKESITYLTDHDNTVDYEYG